MIRKLEADVVKYAVRYVTAVACTTRCAESYERMEEAVEALIAARKATKLRQRSRG